MNNFTLTSHLRRISRNKSAFISSQNTQTFKKYKLSIIVHREWWNVIQQIQTLKFMESVSVIIQPLFLIKSIENG